MTIAVPAAIAQPDDSAPRETLPITTSPITGVPQDLPEALRLPGEPPALTPTFTAFAKGYQIYICQAEENVPKNYGWVLKAPMATLYGAYAGNQMSSHRAAFSRPNLEIY